HIECDTADLQFIGHTLRLATIQGSPATFELQRPESEEITYAEAGRLEYDLSTGIVVFSENAVITEGGNQISSSLLVYNITEQRINAQSSGDGSEKVKITYTPVADEEARLTQGITEEIAEEIADQATDESGDETQ
ncbi:MAG: LptA/OstA family protein, partial [Woeseiaceae bacterium]